MRLRRPIRAVLLAVLATGCAVPRWPVDGPLTSPFGFRLLGLRPGIHRGVDIAVSEGTEVRAMAPGRVRYAGTMRGYGKVVWIDHGGSVMSVYAHLSQISVTAGEELHDHDPIGLSGSSGDAQAPHLHFEIWRWGRQVDPVPLLGGRPGD